MDFTMEATSTYVLAIWGYYGIRYYEITIGYYGYVRITTTTGTEVLPVRSANCY